MKEFIVICTLFIIGAVAGWVIEVLFRRFFTAKKWINPGFMVGPYLPLYGFGVLILYCVMLIPINTGNVALNYVILILIIGVALTLIELIAGLIFIKGLKVKLWDYSDRWLNYKGIICPLFSLFWLVAGALYAIFLNPLLVNAVTWIGDNIIYSFFVGILIGCVIVDLCYSLHLGMRVKKANDGIVIKFDEFKSYLRENYEKKSFSFFSGKFIKDKAKLHDEIEKYKISAEEKAANKKKIKEEKKAKKKG